MTDEELEALIARGRKTWLVDTDDFAELAPPRHSTRKRRPQITHHRHRKPRRKLDWTNAAAQAKQLGVRDAGRWNAKTVHLARCFLLQGAIISDLQARVAAQRQHIRRLQAALADAEDQAATNAAYPESLRRVITRLQADNDRLRQALLDQDEAWRLRLPQMVRRLGVAGRPE